MSNEPSEKLEAAEKQAAYCKKKDLPHFAPRNGICWSCQKDIYEHERTAREAGSNLITGCPWCCRSYCD